MSADETRPRRKLLIAPTSSKQSMSGRVVISALRRTHPHGERVLQVIGNLHVWESVVEPHDNSHLEMVRNRGRTYFGCIEKTDENLALGSVNGNCVRQFPPTMQEDIEERTIFHAQRIVRRRDSNHTA